MRLAGIFLGLGMVVGCASPQVADQGAPDLAATPPASAAVPASDEPAAAPAAGQETSAPAAAPAGAAKTAKTLPKKSGYKVVTKNGVQMYCSTEPVTGSLVQTKSACYTAEQLEQQRKASRDAVNEVSRRTTPTAGGS
ncbi:MAG TPA: hypothetical protein VJ764_01720 [Steroidobacteraceae bacterium]|nr:hypothetical protein [Steroidobacteraceae bacterium]